MSENQNNVITSEERTKLLWELYHSVLDFLINIFKNPSNEISASLVSCAIKFLKANGITLENRPMHSEIVQELEGMYDLPFDKDGNPMLQKLKTQ